MKASRTRRARSAISSRSPIFRSFSPSSSCCSVRPRLFTASLVTASFAADARSRCCARSASLARKRTTSSCPAPLCTVAAMALVLGVPLGILAGRVGWNRVTDSLFVEPEPVVPLLTIVLVGLGMIVFSGCVALVPARLARRREPGYVYAPSEPGSFFARRSNSAGWCKASRYSFALARKPSGGIGSSMRSTSSPWSGHTLM